jgi:AcrR family transcriptional regulator
MTKAQILEKLTHVFRANGFNGSSLATLAAITNLSKASLYHHFPNGKQQMVELVLAEEGKRLQHLVLSPVSNVGAGYEGLLESLNNVGVFYGDAVPACLMNSVLIGDEAGVFRSAVGGAVSAWCSAYSAAYTNLVSNLAEGEAWGNYAIERIQGALILCRVKASRRPLEQCLLELKCDVLAYA